MTSCDIISYGICAATALARSTRRTPRCIASAGCLIASAGCSTRPTLRCTASAGCATESDKSSLPPLLPSLQHDNMKANEQTMITTPKPCTTKTTTASTNRPWRSQRMSGRECCSRELSGICKRIESNESNQCEETERNATVQ